VGDLFAGAFVAVAIAGVIHAEASFVPEVTVTRKRQLPTLSLLPFVGPGGAGLAGSF
jgi:hypothetical protein